METESFSDLLDALGRYLQERWDKVALSKATAIGDGIYEVELSAEEMNQELVLVKVDIGKQEIIKG